MMKLAAHLLSMTAETFDQAQQAGEILEVNCDAQNQIVDP